jgi:predicted flap endonuclease-1-like 5' DNA nuclease
VKNIISKLSLESNKLSAKKTVVPKFDLTRIKGIGPKTIKKLKKMGIMKTSDLLRVAPGDLADKTGISYKIITRWIKDAAKLSKGKIY